MLVSTQCTEIEFFKEFIKPYLRRTDRACMAFYTYVKKLNSGLSAIFFLHPEVWDHIEHRKLKKEVQNFKSSWT